MEDIIVNNRIVIPSSAIRFRFSRSGGKGGQNVNKVSTKVELIVALDEIRTNERTKNRILSRLRNKLDDAGTLRVISQESRSQWQNKQNAVDKLVRIISNASIEQIERVATKPSRSSKFVRVEKKKKEGRQKQLRRKDVLSRDI